MANQITERRTRIRERHSRRSGTWPAMMMFEFPQSVNCPARRLLPACSASEFSCNLSHFQNCASKQRQRPPTLTVPCSILPVAIAGRRRPVTENQINGSLLLRHKMATSLQTHRGGPGRSPAQAPLRTVRESFPSYGSSLSMDTSPCEVSRLGKPDL